MDSHQRAVERARITRIEKQVLDVVSRIFGSQTVPPPVSPGTEMPWYERGLFWGVASTFFTIVITVVATMLRDIRPLLFLALPFGVIAWSVVLKPLKASRWQWRKFALVACSGLTALGLVAIYRAFPKPVGLQPIPVENTKKEPPSQPEPRPGEPLKPPNQGLKKRVPPKSLPQQPPLKGGYQGFTEASPPFLSMGGIHVLDLAGLAASGQIRTLLGQEIPVRCHLKDSNLYCDANLWSESGTAVSVRDNVFSIFVPTWDRNFTDEALEVVNEYGQPVLQIIRRAPSHWEVNGVFTKPNGEVCVVTEKQIVFGFLGPNVSPEVRQRNETTIHNAEAEIKPIFKYPSYQHRGEFASQ